MREFFHGLWTKKVALVLVLASVAMVYQGWQRGEVQVVFEKAVRICMECIGIG